MGLLDLVEAGRPADDLAPSQTQPDQPRSILDVVFDPGTGVAQRMLDDKKPWSDAEQELHAAGVDPKKIEPQYKLQRARQDAVGMEPNKLQRVVGLLPFAGAAMRITNDQMYNAARKKFDAGDTSDDVVNRIAQYEEMKQREHSASTGETVLKVPGMIVEAGIASKVLGPLGLGGSSAPGASAAMQAGQYAGRSALTAAAMPSMTAEIASQRSVSDNTPITDLKNIVPAAALGTLNTAVLGSLQRMSELNVVPTAVGRAVAKGAVGMGEQMGADTVATASDQIIADLLNPETAKKWSTGTNHGVVLQALRGDAGAEKQAIAQAVTFTLFAAAHPGQKPKVPAPRQKSQPAGDSPIDATVRMIQTGKAAETAKLNDEFNQLLADPRTAGDAMQIMKDRATETKDAATKQYVDMLSKVAAPVVERYKAAAEKVSPEAYAKQPEPPVPGFDPHVAWRDAGMDPIGTWAEKDVRGLARQVGMDPKQPLPQLRRQIMDEFAKEELRLQGAKTPRPNPWSFNAPTKPKTVPAPKPPQTGPVPADVPVPQGVTANPPQTAPEAPGTAPGVPAGQPPQNGTIVAPATNPAVPPRVPAPRPSIDRMRQVQAQRPPVAPAPLEPSLRQGPPQGGGLLHTTTPDVPAVPRDPAEMVKETLTKQGLTAKEAHVLVELQKGRTLEDIGSDKLMQKRGLGVSRQRVKQYETAAKQKAGPDAMNDLKVLLAGKGEFATPADLPENSGSGRARTPAQSRAVRAEKEQQRAADLYAALDKETRAKVGAEPEKYLNDDGTWKVGVLDKLGGTQVVKPTKGMPQPDTLKTRGVRRLRNAVDQAKDNPGPEALDRIKAEEKQLRDVLEQAGEKRPGDLINGWVPRIEDVKKNLATLTELKRKDGESDHAYENRKRRAAGAKTMYDDVSRDVKKWGPFTTESVGKGEAEILREGPLKNLIGTEGKKGLALDTYAEEYFQRHGITPPKDKSAEEHFISLLEQHHLLDEGHWSDKLRAKDEAQRSLFEGDKPAKKPDPWDMPEQPVGESDVLHSGFPIPLQLMGKMSKAVFGRQRGADPDFKPDMDPNLDNQRAMPAWDVAKRAAFNQLGARNTTRPEIATTAHAWQKHVGDQISQAWSMEQATKRPDPFPKDKAGQVTLDNGSKAFLSDVIEAEMKTPGSQALTAEQRAAYDVWRSVLDKQLTLLDAAGVKKFFDANGQPMTKADLVKDGYFHRVAVEPDAGQKAWDWLMGKKKAAGGSPGIKQSFRFGRKHATEADGVAAKVKYEGFYESIVDFLKSSNHEIADHNLANDPLLAGKSTVLREFMKLMDMNQATLRELWGNGSGTTQFRMDMMRLAREKATGNVDVAPAFRGKEYTPEVKEWLEQMYGKSKWRYLPTTRAVLQEFRNTVLGADVSYATLQLQKMLFTNPVRWAKAMYQGGRSFFDPQALGKVLRDSPAHAQAAREITQAGGSIGTMPEQIATLGKGKSFVEGLQYKGYGPGPLYTRFARSMSTALDMTKLELWQATRPADPKQWPRAVEAIENSLGQGRMEQLGMTPERAFLERMTFLAPSYYRAHIKLLEQATQGGIPGHYARKQLVGLAAGVMASGVAALYALKTTGQISDEEFKERMDPTRGKWLMVPLPLGNTGKNIEVGFGGFYRSMMSTAARMKEWQQGKPGPNPLIRWYRGHAAVAPRLAWDVGTEHDFQGQPISPGKAALNTVMPLAAQQTFQGEGTDAQRAASAGVEMTGLSARPGAESSLYTERLRKFAQQEMGKTYSELTIPQQSRLVRQLAATGQGKPQATEDATARARGMEAADARQKALNDGVDKPAQARLKELGHKLPTFDVNLSYNGVDVPLTDGQIKRYQSLLIEEYNKAIARWPAGLKDARTKSKDEFVTSRLEDAKGRAKQRLIHGQ